MTLLLTKISNTATAIKQNQQLHNIYIHKSYVLNTFGIIINGDSAIALYGFTSTSQTSNGDIGGINDKEPGVLDKTWAELGIIINGTLNNITSGEILKLKLILGVKYFFA